MNGICLEACVQAFLAGGIIVGGGLTYFYWWKGWLKFK